MLSILTDRSRIETDWACQRKRYWLTEHQRTGIVPATQHPALALGIVVHHGLEEGIKHMHEMDTLGYPETWEMEKTEEWKLLNDDQQDTARAMVIGFFLTIWPQWMKQYKPIAVEQEMTMALDVENYPDLNRLGDGTDQTVTVMARPDLILEDKTTGDLWYPDFKTFSNYFDPKRWMWSLQQQLTMEMAEKNLGRPLAGAWIQGLSKGSGRRGTIYHALVYGYRHPGAAGVSEPTFGTKRRSGFERFNTKEYPHGGVEGWIRQLMKKDPELITKNFPQSQPLFLQSHLMKELKQQIYERENKIHALQHQAQFEIGNHIATEKDHMSAFPLNITQCESIFGRCAYFDACHVNAIRQDPIGSGAFVPRVPHHALEREATKKA